MGEVCSRLADEAVVTSDNPRSEDPCAIIADITAGMAGTETVLPERREAIAYALEQAKEGDTVLVCGKGHETTQEIKGVKYPFDDRKEVASFRKGGHGDV